MLIVRAPQGYISNLTHVGRKSLLVLFINARPVECAQLKRAVEAMYTAQNPKATKPFLFMVGDVTLAYITPL